MIIVTLGHRDLNWGLHYDSLCLTGPSSDRAIMFNISNNFNIKCFANHDLFIQDDIWKGTAHLNPLLHESQHGRGQWTSKDLFKDPADCPLLEPGAVNLSPVWFDQGHKVCAHLKLSSVAHAEYRNSHLNSSPMYPPACDTLEAQIG